MPPEGGDGYGYKINFTRVNNKAPLPYNGCYIYKSIKERMYGWVV